MKLIIPILLITLVLLISGCSLFQNYSAEQYQEAEKISIEFIQNNYQDVSKVYIDSVEDAPMGGINVHGTVNKSEFTVGVNNDNDGQLSIGSISSSEGFPDLKPECIKSSCD